MPFAYVIHREPDLQEIVYSGQVTMTDARRFLSEAMRDPRHYHGMPSLIDLRTMTGIDLGFSDMLILRDKLAEVLEGASGQTRIAILAGGETAYGVGRMFAAAAGEIPGVEVEVFGSRDDALAFHDLPPTSILTANTAAALPSEATG